MKNVRIVAAVLLVVLLSAGINNTASAHPWRHRAGWCGPRIAVGIAVPPVVLAAPYYGPAYRGGYYGPAYYGHPYARPYAYCRPHYAQPNYGYHHAYRRY